MRHYLTVLNARVARRRRRGAAARAAGVLVLIAVGAWAVASPLPARAAARLEAAALRGLARGTAAGIELRAVRAAEALSDTRGSAAKPGVPSDTVPAR